MTTIKDIYADYAKENIGTKISIELEVSKEDAEQVKDKFPTLKIKMESYRIGEILNIHELATEARQKIYKDIKKIYKDKFPVWQDTYLSWGVHFHAFFKETINRDTINSLQFKLNFNDYNKNFQALPLYAKAQGHKFCSRPNGQDFEWNSDTLAYNMMWRTSVGGFRNSFRSHQIGYGYNTNEWRDEYKSIEFRCNNITDTRIYGYYIGQLLLAEQGIKLNILSTTLRSERTSFNKWYKAVSELTGTTYSGEDSEKIRSNFAILLVTLRKNGFREAAKQLRAYAKEFAII